MSFLGLDLGKSKSIVRISHGDSNTKNQYDFHGNGSRPQTDSSGSLANSDNETLMKVMACGEAVVQSAFGQIKKKIHTSVVEFKGPQAASLDDIWYKKLASDSIMYISCFGFVPVKLVKIPRETGTVIVPVVVALSQIEWEFDAEVGGLFTCPRVFYKDTGSRASSFPRIYVYCIQSHTVDMCRLGPLCSSIAPYRELLEARDYTRRCNEENLKNYRFVETRSRDPPVPRAGTRPDMMSVLENTIRALPCHTNSHDDDKTEMFEPSFQKQKLVHALMSQSNGMPCVLPDDCVVSDCKHEVPQLNMAMYNQSFERSVYMALSIKGGGAPDSTDEHAVLLFELETMLALFASATMDTDLAGKVQKSERDMQEGRSQRAGKRRRTRKNQKMLVDTECINILSIWVTPLVECSIKPHVSSDMSLTMKLYEEGSITKDTYSKYIKKTTGLNTAGASGKAPTAV